MPHESEITSAKLLKTKPFIYAQASNNYCIRLNVKVAKIRNFLPLFLICLNC